jgi:hypothetical protein
LLLSGNRRETVSLEKAQTCRESLDFDSAGPGHWRVGVERAAATAKGEGRQAASCRTEQFRPMLLRRSTRTAQNPR